jgi:hypothetical protein
MKERVKDMKKKLNRFVSKLLALLFLAVTCHAAFAGIGGGLLALYASAYDYTAATYSGIYAINGVRGVRPPVAGETPDTAITPEGEYTGAVSWYNDTDDEAVSPETSFVRDKEYTATFTLTAVTEGSDVYSFWAVTGNYQFDYSDPETLRSFFSVGALTPELVGEAFTGPTDTLVFKISFSAAGMALDVSELSVPLPMPGDSVPKAYIGGVIGEHLTGDIEWWDYPNDSFIVGTTVLGYFKLTADEGYTFPYTFDEDVSLTVNGGAVDVRFVGGNDGKHLVGGLTCTVPGAYTLVGTPAIDITAPKFGDVLTVDTSGLTALGTGASLGEFSYQWKRDGAPIAGAVDETYTVVKEDIGKAVTVTVSNAYCYNTVTSSATDAAAKADGPSAPAVAGGYASNGETYTYTVAAPASGALYKMDDGAWQTAKSFSGIVPGSQHTFYAKTAETDTHLESAPGGTGPVDFPKLPQDPPVILYTLAGNYADGGVTVTITNPASGATYSTDPDDGYGANPVIAVNQGISSVTIYVRLDETATLAQSAAASAAIDFTKDEQAPPSIALTYAADGTTDYTVTIARVQGAEYSFDGITWSDADGANVKANCPPNASVSGYIRYKETDEYNASPAAYERVLLPLFQAQSPVAAPDGGTFTTSVVVSLTSATAGAEIFYTLDGSAPTAHSTKYTAPFTLTATTTVKAVAVKTDMRNSEVLTVAFTKQNSGGGNPGGGNPAAPVPTPAPDDEADTGSWANPFTDVTASDWFFGDVAYAATHGLFKGVSATSFSPNTPMTRGMLVTVLHRLAEEPATASSAPFNDVETGAYYANAVSWASANGVINGVSADTFAPETVITREQFATMLYRYAKDYLKLTAVPNGDLAKFTDAGDVSEWARDAVTWAVGAELINGRTATTLAPKGSATRAEVAAVLRRFAETL